MSEGKWEVLRRLAPKLGLPDLEGDETLGQRCARAFGRTALLLLDVGVGDGTATVAWAVEHPDSDVVAVEVHTPSVVATLSAIDAAALTNVRVVDADVRTVLDRAAPGDLRGVRLLFPDPWPKRRHRHRRLVDGPFVDRVAHTLDGGGTFHVATDWDDYASQVDRAARDDGRFAVVSTERPARPVTTYERRGMNAQRTVSEVLATRLLRDHSSL